MQPQILIVDDNPGIRDLLVYHLERSDFVVFVAKDGREAHNILQREHIDLIVTDQEMPRFTGDMLAAVLAETHPDLPIILLTGHPDYLEHPPRGVRRVIRKPFTLQILDEALHALLPHPV